MSDDLYAIIGCCILGMIAHASRRHPWMEWFLRVTYCFFLFGFYVNLQADPQIGPEGAWHHGILLFTTTMTGLMLFKPVRQLLSIVLTFVDQIVGGRVFLAAIGKLTVPTSSLKAKAEPVTFVPRASSFPDITPTGEQKASTSADLAPKDESLAEPAGKTDDESDKPKSENEGSESSEVKSASAETSSEPAVENTSVDTEAPETSEAVPEPTPESKSDASSAAPSSPSSDAAASIGAASASAAAATGTPVAAAAASAAEAPAFQKVSFINSFLAERIFVPESIPHLNGLWIYVTCMAFLLMQTDTSGFQMPAIMMPIPVTMDQLFSYNFLGLIFLAFCGCGFLITRKPMETLRRLGLVKPTWAQVGIGVAGIFMTFAYDYLWSTYTHSQEGLGYAEKLTHYNEGTFTGGASPAPAMLLASATGLCAGLGEETLIRGALQPVFGILPAAFMHGVLHGQFAHAPLLILQVFGWSTLMCIIRRYTNTTTTIITHVGFNFLSTFLISFNP